MFLTDIYLLSKFGIQNWARSYTNTDQKVDTTLTFYTDVDDDVFVCCKSQVMTSLSQLIMAGNSKLF